MLTPSQRQAMWKAATLKAGEVVQYIDGSVWRVYRISPTGAYVRCIKGSGQEIVREVEFAKSNGKILAEPVKATFHTTTGRRVGQAEIISATSGVRRLNREDYPMEDESPAGTPVEAPAVPQETTTEPAASEAPEAAPEAPTRPVAAPKGKRRAVAGKPPLNLSAVAEKVGAAVVEAPTEAPAPTVKDKATPAPVKAKVPKRKAKVAPSDARPLRDLLKEGEAEAAKVKPPRESKPNKPKRPKAKPAKAAKAAKEPKPPKEAKATSGKRKGGKRAPKLPDADITKMRALRKKDPKTYTFDVLAKQFGCTGKVAWHLCNAKH